MAVHAGVNVQIAKFNTGATSSGSLTVACTPIPAGAEVTGIQILGNNQGWGDGSGVVSAWASIGGNISLASAQYVFIRSATFGRDAPEATANRGGDIGKRITSSANLYVALNNLVSTGTATLGVTVVLQYLARKRGD